MGVCMFLNFFRFTQQVSRQNRINLMVRGGLVHLVQQKIVRVDITQLQTLGQGAGLSLVDVDVERVIVSSQLDA